MKIVSILKQFVGSIVALSALCCALMVNAQTTKCQVRDQDIAAVYKGGCKDGLAHGKGLAKGRDVFEGEFFEGDKLKGKYTWANGTTYDGEWKNDKQHGRGTMRNGNGDLVFEGQWVNGKRQGKSEQEKQEVASVCGKSLGEYQKAKCVVMTTDNFQCILGAAERYKKICGK